ncbi:sugar phosphate isomerase/epimerase [Gemmatimonas sp.]|uniref:sugar phosphate isomerase/epimerase family protein n=1 Tax=Gemmatimonas sp. TaxID=1962908 RepID=UPI00286B311D|nr:sugar phosphate isomerase/epimerase [Gemmatimonas sp.]
MDLSSFSQSALSRREALQLLAVGVAGGAVLPSLAHAASGDDADRRRIGRIGLQLYTVRTALSKDLEGTIAAVAAAGITELEFAGYYDKSPAWWSERLKKHKLTAPATHEALPATDDGWSAILDRAKGMGHEIVIVPFVGNAYRGSRDNWLKLSERLNTGAQKAKAAGLQFAYHNHDFEFAPVGDTTGYEILTSNTDASLVKLELDMYWAVKAGRDPLDIMTAHKGRVICCHVKDASAAPERKMLDVGAGTIDFKMLLDKGRKLGLKHWFIEHDQPADALASIKASAAAMLKY